MKVPEVVELFNASSKKSGGFILLVVQRQIAKCQVLPNGVFGSCSPARVSVKGKSSAAAVVDLRGGVEISQGRTLLNWS